MCLLTECQRLSERAILALDDATRGGHEEMHLQEALGVSLMFTRGNSEAARVALARSLAIAEERGDAPDQLQLLNLLHMFHHRIGDFKTALYYGRRSLTAAETIAIPSAVALAHCLLGSSLHHIGDLGGARAELEAALQGGPGYQRTSTIYLDFEHYNYAGVALARTLVAAIRLRRNAEEQIRTRPHASGSAIQGVGLGGHVFLWAGDLDSADSTQIGKHTCRSRLLEISPSGAAQVRSPSARATQEWS